jgi:DtxR family Mn-dependent transcriptional regulator
MQQDRVEEYLGAIYRLRSDPENPLPLSELKEYFGFSPVSIHEMIQKLDNQGWVVYHPYRGVTLTERGEEAALALLRRHRLWERFLTDVLDIAWDQAHVIAGRLEHAATEVVTDRLARFLGEPDHCPHGAPIPPTGPTLPEQCLTSVVAGARARVVRISPETPERLQNAEELDLVPGQHLYVVDQEETCTQVMIEGDREERSVQVPAADAAATWVLVL